MPSPQPETMNILYADDITQIIIQPGKSKNMLSRKIEREVRHVNDFEKNGKLKPTQTNSNCYPKQ